MNRAIIWNTDIHDGTILLASKGSKIQPKWVQKSMVSVVIT